MAKLTRDERSEILDDMVFERDKHKPGSRKRKTWNRAIKACGGNVTADRDLSFEEAHMNADRWDKDNADLWKRVIALMTEVNWGHDYYLEEEVKKYSFEEQLENARKLPLLSEEDYANNQRRLHSREDTYRNPVGAAVQMSPSWQWLGILPRSMQGAHGKRIIDALEAPAPKPAPKPKTRPKRSPEAQRAERKRQALPKFRL